MPLRGGSATGTATAQPQAGWPWLGVGDPPAPRERASGGKSGPRRLPPTGAGEDHNDAAAADAAVLRKPRGRLGRGPSPVSGVRPPPPATSGPSSASPPVAGALRRQPSRPRGPPGCPVPDNAPPADDPDPPDNIADSEVVLPSQAFPLISLPSLSPPAPTPGRPLAPFAPPSPSAPGGTRPPPSGRHSPHLSLLAPRSFAALRLPLPQSADLLSLSRARPDRAHAQRPLASPSSRAHPRGPPPPPPPPGPRSSPRSTARVAAPIEGRPFTLS